jgi:hypothetical protein
MAQQNERRIGTVEKLYSSEDELGVACVFKVINHELARLEGELVDITRRIDHFLRAPVVGVRAAASAGNRRPEVVKDMGVEAAGA